MKIQAKDVGSHLQKNLAACYLVSGDEHLLVGETLDAIRQAARAEGFTSRELHIATTGFDWPRLLGSSANLSLFADKRIVELRLPTGKPGQAGAQAIIDLTRQAGSDLLFIVSTPKLDRTAGASKWAKAIDSRGVTVPIWPISTSELPGWIGARMRAAGLQPDRDAIALIADRVEGNLLAGAQEIEKLRLRLGAGRVSAEAVTNAVADSSRYDVYKLVDAALAGKPRRALRILTGLRAEGIEAFFVVWALTRELRSLGKLDDAIRQGADLSTGMQKAGVWRNRQGLVRSCIGRHQHGAFHCLLKAAARADQAAKGQISGDPWQLAGDLVVALASGRRQAA